MVDKMIKNFYQRKDSNVTPEGIVRFFHNVYVGNELDKKHGENGERVHVEHVYAFTLKQLALKYQKN